MWPYRSVPMKKHEFNNITELFPHIVLKVYGLYLLMNILIFSSTEAVKLTEYSVYGGGSVEAYDNLHDRWGSICASDWTKDDADVVCRQLGFQDGAAHGQCKKRTSNVHPCFSYCSVIIRLN